MNTKSIIAGMSLLAMVSCQSHYRLADASRTRILIDSRYDGREDKATLEFMAPYKAKVDSVIMPKVGETARYLNKYQPESPLSNLLADILVWAGKDFGEAPDFGVYNIGGIRAALPDGTVTVGDVMEVAPFENKICFCTLTGEKVVELFQQMAGYGGQGVSHGVEAKMDAKGNLLSLKLNGSEIDPQREYRVATLDYCSEGNDKMVAFKSKAKVNSPREEKNNVRYIIMDYFRQQAAQGKKVDAAVEGRFAVEK